MIVHTGSQGYCICSTHGRPEWLPHYYSGEQFRSKVRDSTGAMQAFLGGLAVSIMDNSMTIVEAARYGAVSASFAVEQIGPPRIRYSQVDEELWNKVKVRHRLEEYRRKPLELAGAWTLRQLFKENLHI